ncbi:lipoprotein-releasing ABC transporter permease subunit [uncultured Psychrosphaera sp.]|uniref:lipoprotein-releasing ABC transporter permease subunit n=1 Tax=uncultured Psychrosphaera sp. TaxID=1403522 RepID=UPI002629D372|nr:lipoprotein-releasing ABC transporter permease subunit [uncultured Psychrosphaera sp.]
MNLPISLQIGLRYSKAAKDGKFISFISFFSMAGIALGVLALILVMSVMDGFEGILKQRILGAVPHVIIEPEQTKNQLTVAQFNKTVEGAEFTNNVIQVLPLVQSVAIMQLPSDLKGVMAQGISGNDSIPLGVTEHLAQGSWSEFLDFKYGVVVGQYLAMEYGLGVGDKVRLMISGTSHYTPIGRMPSQRTFTIVGMFQTESEIDEQLIFVRSQDLNRLMKKPPKDNAGIRLVLNDAFLANDVAQKLADYYPAEDYKIENWHDTHGKLFDAVKMEKTMMWFMLSLIICVAAFNIVSALVMMVTKKQNEVAILKTLGMTQNTISNIFIVQGAYNGILGALFGGGLGAFLTLNLNGFMNATGLNFLGVAGVGLPIDFSWMKLFYIVSLAIVLALLASIYPARKASQLMPADVLRYE